MKLSFQKFSESDFPEYKGWFSNAEMNKSLGPMDEKWLHHVLKMEDGIEYAIFLENDLIAVLGMKLPTSDYPDYYLTDLAVSPSLQRKGIGSEVLRELFELHPLEENRSWVAFIDQRNTKALQFFEKNGWISESEVPDKDGMFRLSYQKM